MDQELLRVRDHLYALNSSLQQILVSHEHLGGIVGTVKVMVDGAILTLNQVQTETKMIPLLERRVQLLERIVFGACALMLTAVVAAWLAGAIIVPGRDVLKSLGGS